MEKLRPPRPSWSTLRPAGHRFGLLPLALCALLAPSAAGAATSSPEALAIVDRMIAAHGGMEAWTSAPSVRFEDEFRGGTEDAGQPSRVTVEQGRRRAYLDFPGTDMRMAWDGAQAWSLNWQLPTPPRFLALLNYYFLNLPWLARDPGVVLGAPRRARVQQDPTESIAIRMTFEAGTGDTPDDYYVLYIDPASYRLRGCEYIVTYGTLLPEGAEQTPPHDLLFEAWATVDGLLVPTRYTIYEKDGAVYARCEVRDWSFRRPFEAARVAMPPGAVVDTSTP